MLDIQFIKENREIVEKAMRDRRSEAVDIDELLSHYEKRQEMKRVVDDIRRQQNEAADARDVERGRTLKEELRGKEEELRKVAAEMSTLLAKIPNIPSADTPVGADENDNVAIRQGGTKPEFSFTPREHDELGRMLGIIDSERAAKVSGSRFTYIRGAGALMQLGFINLVFKTLTDETILKNIAGEAGLSVSTKPFEPVFPPTLVKPEMLFGMARLEPKEDRFFLDADSLFLSGSAEHTLGPMLAGETLSVSEAPHRFIGYSTAYRREAGSYGKDTRGIIRQHQFDKLEMESFTSPQDSRIEHEFMVAIQEYLVKQLGLHYQVVAVCTGDMGDPDTKQTDIEVWMPAQECFRETHSADFVGSYQARRLGIKIEDKKGGRELAHMNDATAIAVGRTLAAVLENYQQEDGSVRVPDALREVVGQEYIRPL